MAGQSKSGRLALSGPDRHGASTHSEDMMYVDPNGADEAAHSGTPNGTATGIAADDERRMRKLQHGDEFAEFQQTADLHRLRSEHLASRRKIFAAQRKRNAEKIAEHVSEVKRLRGESNVMAGAERELVKQLGPDAKAWVEDEKTLKKWEAFFNLEAEKPEATSL